MISSLDCLILKLINSARHLRWCFKDDPDLAEIRFNQGFNPEPF